MSFIYIFSVCVCVAMRLSLSQIVLVLGGTGQTGRHVVRQLLQEGHTVRAVVRSKERMLELLQQQQPEGGQKSPPLTTLSSLELTEASFLDLPLAQVQSLVQDCNAVVSCLGHCGTLQGIWGQPRQLVTESIQRLYQAILLDDDDSPPHAQHAPTKLILLGTVLVPHPKEPRRTLWERFFLSTLGLLLPPHADNDAAANYLYHHHAIPSNNNDNDKRLVEWCVVRPNLLVDQDHVTPHRFEARLQAKFFEGNYTSSRINVANSMVKLIQDEQQWETWKYQWPVLFDNNDTEEEES